MPRRVVLILTSSILLSALGIALVIVLTGERESLAHLGSLSSGALALCLTLLAAHYLSGGARLAMLTELCNVPVSLWHGTRAFILGLFCAAVTPSGGGNAPAIALSLQRDGVTGSLALVVALYTSILDLLFFAWSIPVAALFLALSGDLPPLLFWLSLIFTPLCLFLWYALSFELRRFKRAALRLFTLPLLKRWQRTASRFLGQLDSTAQFIARQPLTQQLSLQLVTALLHGSLYAIFFVVANDLGLEVTLAETLALILLVSVTSYAVPTPGSSGYLEVALTYTFAGTAAGTTGATALVIPAVLAWRGLSFYLSVLIGALLGGGILVKKIAAHPKGDHA